jgi:AraC-like DNA-binding protein
MISANNFSPPRVSGKLPTVSSIGISTWDPVWAMQDHRNQTHELVFIVSGQVTLHLGNRTYHGTAESLLLIPTQHLHRDEFRLDSVFRALLIQFNWPDLANVFTGITNNHLARLPLADKQVAREMVLDLYRTFQTDRPLGQELTNACLYRLLLFLAGAVRGSRLTSSGRQRTLADEHHRRIIAEAKTFIRQNLHQPITLTDLADHLKISPYHLSHVFSRESGFTLSSYVIRMRMEEATRLLTDPGKTVAEVAYASGFEDPNYFGKVFRRYFNKSPGDYRTTALSRKRV